MENQFETPILYVVFNRLDVVKKTFPIIAKQKPKQLFIAADGPRNNKEKKKTDAVRQHILKNIDYLLEKEHPRIWTRRYQYHRTIGNSRLM